MENIIGRSIFFVYLLYNHLLFAICAIGQSSRVFSNDQEDRVQSQVGSYTNTQKTVPDAALLSTQHYKVRIKCNLEQSSEWSNALPNTSV